MSNWAGELKIDSMAYGGRGVGRRADGKVVFVPLVIPGEFVRVSTVREHRGYVDARLDEVIEASPGRVQPGCRHFPACGGCDWQHMAYDLQVMAKDAILQEQIEAKGIVPARLEEPVASPRAMGYRCHATLRCARSGAFQAGFFSKLSHTLVPVEQCPVLNDTCNETLHQLRVFFTRHPWAGIVDLEIHAPGEGALLRLGFRRPSVKTDRERLHALHQGLGLQGLSAVFSGGRHSEYVLGGEYCCYEVLASGKILQLRSGFGAFIQANMAVNQSLVAHVCDALSGSEDILDLYSGSGNFGIPLSLCAGRVLAVEHDDLLVEAGRAAARDNGRDNLRFLREGVSKTVQRLEKQGRRFHAVVLDPPREGVRGILPGIVRLQPQKIAYISCNPSTLARDLAQLAAGGYRVVSLRLFDMFPQTFHIESVAVLERV
ncbi:MAG TPA: class I SAM-dependent RNA methyltransferase [Deltaproteobacteria bacterium]|nr:class I SAM-dependent RNA methyltransferase [Deltaproteobacteria bacterium]